MHKWSSSLTGLIAVALLSLGSITGCGEYKPVLKDLSGVDELKARFNRDAGKPRVVLLLSPT
jgi:hypothetical protein